MNPLFFFSEDNIHQLSITRNNAANEYPQTNLNTIHIRVPLKIPNTKVLIAISDENKTKALMYPTLTMVNWEKYDPVVMPKKYAAEIIPIIKLDLPKVFNSNDEKVVK